MEVFGTIGVPYERFEIYMVTTTSTIHTPAATADVAGGITFGDSREKLQSSWGVLFPNGRERLPSGWDSSVRGGVASVRSQWQERPGIARVYNKFALECTSANRGISGSTTFVDHDITVYDFPRFADIGGMDIFSFGRSITEDHGFSSSGKSK